MGQSQSSRADNSSPNGITTSSKKTTFSSKESTATISKSVGVGGRKSAPHHGGREAPHGLVGSLVSEPSAFAMIEDPSETYTSDDEHDHHHHHHVHEADEDVDDVDLEVLVEVEELEEATSDTDSESDEDEDEEEEEDEEWEERLLVLQDARSLKQMASFFLHPERSVQQGDGCSRGRNYFSRYSAPARVSLEEMEEQDRALEDLQALKRLAKDYLHPEIAVVTSDAAACGRNYFTRPSAPVVDEAEMDERARILSDAAALKELAVAYGHPEVPVVTSDPAAFGRSYFSRPSAPVAVAEDEFEERQRILADAAALKKLAVDYAHPEVPVVTSDPAACGRNYFTRASAQPYEDAEEAEERALILSEAAALKKVAVDYLHPELPVATTDPTIFGRSYFGRASAPLSEMEWEEAEDRVGIAEDRLQLLADARALKAAAVDWLHPERPVVTTDPAACGRNYFTRASAPAVVTEEEAEERAQILEEAKALKAAAVDYLHPERPVVTTDPTACGRNYFTRASAEPYEDAEEFAERARILADAKALKSVALDYLHPERPVVTSDPTACGRNYFTRASAVPQMHADEAAEREQILQDAKALKSVALDYLHPERPVVTSDPTACGRNYFTRASAAPQEDAEEAAERAGVLADAKALLKLAVDYQHPELGVITTDPTACGRNYFERASALGHDHMVHTFPVHEDDQHHDDHHSEHLDHFGMDEDAEMRVFDDMRQEFPIAAAASSANNGPIKVGSDEEGGNLSRSPSSVMLFNDEPIYE